MKQRVHMLEQIVRGMDLNTEPLPTFPLVEIVGDHRILIENHCGVTKYSCNEICARVKFGCISICGSSLQLALMTKYRLIVKGRIDNVQLIRGK